MANQQPPATQPAIQPCRYKVGKTLGAGSYSTVKECVHIDTGRYYAAKVINKRLMAGREHMVSWRYTIQAEMEKRRQKNKTKQRQILNMGNSGPQRNRRPQKSIHGPPKHPHPRRLL